MNYYEHHLGDYAKDTAHLTMLEHGAYRLLLDRYYSTEQPIPADQAHRVARARSTEEKQAVDDVLKEFFTLENGCWISKRAANEITKARSKIKAAQENGKRGGRPKTNPEQNQTQTENKPSGFSAGSEVETQPKAHQTPDTNHQTPYSNNKDTDTSTNMPTVTTAGVVCGLMRSKGLADANPSHAKLHALLAAGAAPHDFAQAAELALSHSPPKGFAFALGIVANRMADNAAKPPSVHVGLDDKDYGTGVQKL